MRHLRAPPHARRPAKDLVFVITEQPHARFKRSGNDLATTVQVSRAASKGGGTPANAGARAVACVGRVPLTTCASLHTHARMLRRFRWCRR